MLNLDFLYGNICAVTSDDKIGSIFNKRFMIKNMTSHAHSSTHFLELLIGSNERREICPNKFRTFTTSKIEWDKGALIDINNVTFWILMLLWCMAQAFSRHPIGLFGTVNVIFSTLKEITHVPFL